METKTIVIPFRPHRFQSEIVENLKRFSVLVCHRRFGKTVLCTNILIREALKTTRLDWRGAYLAPLYRQAKAAAWDYMKKYTAVVPGVKIFNQELKIDFPNGSRISLLGADNPDSLRGIYLDFAILDEYADMRSGLWGEILRPALTDKRGSAIFIGTPRGHNHFYQVYQDAHHLPDWGHAFYAASQTDVLDRDELEQVRAEITPDEYAQEFECSFEAAIKGAYYGTLMEAAEKSGRVCNVPYDPIMPVNTAWDLGISDATAIWFFQVSPGGEVRVIDYLEHSGEGLAYYARELDNRGYKYGHHLAPHDIRVRELGTGRSRLEMAETLGIRFDVVPEIGVIDGIDAARATIPRCWFDKTNAALGIESLKQYRKEFSDKLSIKGRDMFSPTPLHNWASHGADAFRMLAVGIDIVQPIPAIKINMPSYSGRQQGWML